MIIAYFYSFDLWNWELIYDIRFYDLEGSEHHSYENGQSVDGEMRFIDGRNRVVYKGFDGYLYYNEVSWGIDEALMYSIIAIIVLGFFGIIISFICV